MNFSIRKSRLFINHITRQWNLKIEHTPDWAESFGFPFPPLLECSNVCRFWETATFVWSLRKSLYLIRLWTLQNYFMRRQTLSCQKWVIISSVEYNTFSWLSIDGLHMRSPLCKCMGWLKALMHRYIFQRLGFLR